MAAIIIEFAVVDLIDMIVGDAASRLVIDLIGPFFRQGGTITTADHVLQQVVIDGGVEDQPAAAQIVIGVVVLHPRRVCVVGPGPFRVGRFGAQHHHFTGVICRIEQPVAGVDGAPWSWPWDARIPVLDTPLDQAIGDLIAPVRILLVERPGIVVEAIGLRGIPRFGAIVIVRRQISFGIGGIDDVEAAKLAMIVILPIAVRVPGLRPIIARNPGIAHTLGLLRRDPAAADRVTTGIGTHGGQAIMIGRGRQRNAIGTIGAQRLDLRHDQERSSAAA